MSFYKSNYFIFLIFIVLSIIIYAIRNTNKVEEKVIESNTINHQTEITNSGEQKKNVRLSKSDLIEPLPQDVMDYILSLDKNKAKLQQIDNLKRNKPKNHCDSNFIKEMKIVDKLNVIRKQIEVDDYEPLFYTLYSLFGLSIKEYDLMENILEPKDSIDISELSEDKKNILRNIPVNPKSNKRDTESLLSVLKEKELPANLTIAGSSVLYFFDLNRISNISEFKEELNDIGVQLTLYDLMQYIFHYAPPSSLVSLNEEHNREQYFHDITILFDDLNLTYIHLSGIYEIFLTSVISLGNVELLQWLKNRGMKFNRMRFNNSFLNSDNGFREMNIMDTYLLKEHFFDHENIRNTQDVLQYLIEHNDFQMSESALQTYLKTSDDNVIKGMLEESLTVKQDYKIDIFDYIKQNNIDVEKYEKMLDVTPDEKRKLVKMREKTNACVIDYQFQLEQWKESNKNEVERVNVGKNWDDFFSVLHKEYIDVIKNLTQWIIKNESKGLSLRELEIYLLSKEQSLFLFRKYIYFLNHYFYSYMHYDNIGSRENEILKYPKATYSHNLSYPLFVMLVQESSAIMDFLIKDNLSNESFPEAWFSALFMLNNMNRDLPSIDFFEYLQTQGVDLNMTGPYGETLLLVSVIHNNKRLTQYLLNQNITINANRRVFNALDYALLHYNAKDTDILDMLLSSGIVIDDVHKKIIQDLKLESFLKKFK